jgi:exodeoxyribonuclease-5
MLNLNPDQQRVFDLVSNRVRCGEKITTIHGLAGTGKTTVLLALVRAFPHAFLCTKTGKATSNLTRKARQEFDLTVDASTIDAAIHTFIKMDKGTNGRREITWANKPGVHKRLVFLDESSIVSIRDAEDLRKHCDQVVAFGDPGQLGPIPPSLPYFTKPDARLTKIMRQSEGSVIIRKAHHVLSCPDDQFMYATYSEPGFNIFRPHDFDQALLTAANVVLVRTNDERRAYNAMIRERRGIVGSVLQRGEPLMSTHNQKKLGIFNGTICTAAREWKMGQPLYLTDDQRRPPSIEKPTVEGFDPEFEARSEPTRSPTGGMYRTHIPFVPAYAITTHKAQGSEWDHVLIIDTDGGDDRRWLYTAITRAKQRVTILLANELAQKASW